MELILIAGLLVIAFIGYIASLFLLSKDGVRKLWMSLMLFTFIVALVTLLVVHLNSGVLATIKDMAQLYFAYFVIIVLLVVGVINLWVFKSIIWKILTKKPISIDE